MLLKYSFKPRWLMPLTDVQILSGDSKKCTLLNCAIWQMGRSSVEYLVDYSTVSSVRSPRLCSHRFWGCQYAFVKERGLKLNTSGLLQGYILCIA